MGTYLVSMDVSMKGNLFRLTYHHNRHRFKREKCRVHENTKETAKFIREKVQYSIEILPVTTINHWNA